MVLAAGAGDVSLVTAAKQGDRAAVQSLVTGHAKHAVAGAEGTAGVGLAATRNDLAIADFSWAPARTPRLPTSSARRRCTRRRRTRIRR